MWDVAVVVFVLALLFLGGWIVARLRDEQRVIRGTDIGRRARDARRDTEVLDDFANARRRRR